MKRIFAAYDALLDMADLMVHHHSLPELFRAMAERLRQVVAADAANFPLYDPTHNMMRLHVLQGSEMNSAWIQRLKLHPPGGRGKTRSRWW